MAGKPQTLATTSAFEILGPVMVGPSSSHTAGAALRQVAASLLEGRITKVTFGLWNSFAHTYRGHGTDRALVAGILGLDTDDENIKQAFDLAREQGLEYHLASRATTPPSTQHRRHRNGRDTGARHRSAVRAWAAARCASAALTASASTSRVCTQLYSWRTRTSPVYSPRSPTCSPTHT